jgi:hypothetical protein
MRSPTSRGGSSAVKQAVGICVLIAATIGLLMLVPHSSLFTKQAPQIPRDATDAAQYIGEIRPTPTEDGRCHVIEFDNRSGRFSDKGLMPCDPDPSAQEKDGRLDSISKSFKAH